MDAADSACRKDADPRESSNGDGGRHRGHSRSLRCHCNREIALGELLISGENERLMVRLNARPEFAIDDGGHSRYSTSSANRRVHAIKALTVVGGGEAHL